MDMKNRLNEEDLVEMIQLSESPMIRTSKQIVYAHNVFLDEDIGPPTKYRELINNLYMAGENDQFNIFVNNGGGYLSTAMAIVEAIKATAGSVRAIITGDCHSAASIITLNCHEIAVTDSACMMIHTAQFGAGGQSHNVKHHVDFSHSMIDDLLNEMYTGFLTPDEMKEVKNGREFWFNAKQIGKRLENRMKFKEDQRLKKSTTKRTKTASKGTSEVTE